MGQYKDFLFELGTAELPAKLLFQLGENLFQQIQTELKNAKLDFSDAQWFATPRRLAVLIKNLPEQQPNQTIERIGPLVNASFDANQHPTPAALGFARSTGMAVSQLAQQETEKGLCLVFRQEQIGKDTTALLPEIIRQAIKNLSLPKTMRWGNHTASFIRPVAWILILYGKTPITTTVLDLPTQSEAISFGHRFHHPQAVNIGQPADYEKKLMEAKVIAHFETRREFIREKIQAACQTLNDAEAIIDESLLNEVTGLVEWPQILVAHFDESFLQLPREVLIASMQDNQKCFAVKNSHGKLSPHFIVVSNIASLDKNQVIQGNERVMRARFNDALFFYQNDLAKSPGYFEEKLKSVIFQEKLGTLFDKSQRIAALSKAILKQATEKKALSEEEKKALSEAVEKAALSCKYDLVSEMVMEFPELQGIMGGIYFEIPSIREHYYPRFAGDELPNSFIGCVIALADKIDTLIGNFAIGNKPTGDKDPFSLRRAAIGVVRIIIEKCSEVTEFLEIDLTPVLDFAQQLYTPLPATNNVELVKTFVLERAANWYQERQKGSLDEWQAAATSMTDHFFLADIYHRALAIRDFRQLPESVALIAANKRVRNILSKVTETIPNDFDPHLFSTDTEKNLANALIEKQNKMKKFKYEYNINNLVDLNEIINQFFNKVMVMAEEPVIRLNRLALLSKLRNLFLNIGDISLINN